MPNTFCTAINCIDGRIQLPVIKYMQTRFDAAHVDLITEAGPNLILASQAEMERVQAILAGVKISVSKHASVGIAIAGHHDCAGNPASEAEQRTQTKDAVSFLRQHYPELPIIGLWVDGNWEVTEVSCE